MNRGGLLMEKVFGGLGCQSQNFSLYWSTIDQERAGKEAGQDDQPGGCLIMAAFWIGIPLPL